MRSLAPLVPLLFLVGASSASDEPPPALTQAAVEATQAKRYCEALALFEASYARWPDARSLYNAAEVANAAGDRWRAVELYREAQRYYPEYERKGVMQKRLDELGRRIASDGPGAACPRPTARCGDWRLDGSETCDDGNTADDDGCDSNCSVTDCGNGIVTSGEACDPAAPGQGRDCDSNCTWKACGNGAITTGEQCDDGNAVSGDGCDNNCTPTECGNGVVTAGEQCDDGNQRDGDGCDEGCVVTKCGNGILTRGEQCDDGNTNDGDGCESTCTITMVHAPVPGILVASAGVLSGAAAAGLFWAAGYQWLAHQQALEAIEEAERTWETDRQGAEELLKNGYAREESARIAWEGWGRAAIGGGVALSVASVGALVGGVWWAITREVELAPSEDVQ